MINPVNSGLENTLFRSWWFRCFVFAHTAGDRLNLSCIFVLAKLRLLWWPNSDNKYSSSSGGFTLFVLALIRLSMCRLCSQGTMSTSVHYNSVWQGSFWFNSTPSIGSLWRIHSGSRSRKGSISVRVTRWCWLMPQRVSNIAPDIQPGISQIWQGD